MIIIKQMITTLLLTCVLFTSCQSEKNVSNSRKFQKRKYRRGYYVDFNRKQQQTKRENEISRLSQNSNAESLIASTSIIIHKPLILRVEKMNESNLNMEQDSTKKMSQKEFKIAKQLAKADYKLVRKGFLHPSEQYGYANFDPESRKIEPHGIMAAVFSITGTALLLGGLVGVSLVIGVMGLVFAFISLKKYKRHPGIFKGKILAYVPFIILLLAFIIAFTL